MFFSLDVVRARKGDCLLLHYGSKNDPKLIVIDGGPRGVYGPHLKPRIQQIRKARGLANNKPLTVDLLMISHVDDDHIQGILDLTKELIEAKMAHKPQLVQVLGLWHNSFDNLIGSNPQELLAAFTQQFGPAAADGDLPRDVTVNADDDDLDEETIVWNLKVLASISQGAKLRSDADRLNLELNPQFQGKLVLADKGGRKIKLQPGLTCTIIGPMVKELKDLHKKHQEWLKTLKKKGIKPADALAAYVDKSVANLSSIVTLVECGGKSILLTGDARGDKILEGMELVGLIKKGGKMSVDVLKVPHHGSANNLDNDFFERIVASHYVFSGNGEHGNPERESLEMLLQARGNDDYTVHLTYPVNAIDEARKLDWKKEQDKEKKKKKTNPQKKVRPNWSVKKHSLAAFLKDHKEFGKKIRFADDDKPHLIDLADEVTF